MHKGRTLGVGDIEDLDVLVDKLKEWSWTLCTGFRWRGLLILNDSTGEDALQEYAIVREADLMQLESLTVSWYEPAKLKVDLTELADGRWGDSSYAPEPWPSGLKREQCQSVQGHHCFRCE